MNDEVENKHEEHECANDCGCSEAANAEVNLAEENAKLKDMILRTHAEMENLRKRFVKEREDSIKYANTGFSKDIIVAIDNMERAFANCDKDNIADKAFYDGIVITHKELMSVLKKHGVQKIEVSKLDDFDHNLHQVMCEVESENKEHGGKVIDVYQTGYTINGRLLRPALVSVAKKS